LRQRQILGPALLVGALLAVDASAQFNARGRGPSRGARPPAGAPAAPKKGPSAVPKPGPTPSIDEGAERDAALIERYQKLIFVSPGEDVPLTRLAELVRKRDGNLDKLLTFLEAEAASSTDKYAALVAWGGILQKDGQTEGALDRLKQATEVNPTRPQAWQLLGDLEKAQGHLAEARASYEQALPLLLGAERSLLVRTLRDLSLDAGDYDAAATYHRTLTKEASGNLFLKGELGRELLSRGQTARAVKELESVVKEAHGDARAAAPALKDLGEAELALGDVKKAQKTLEKASRLAVSSPGLRTAIDTLRAEAHRKDGTLTEFLKELEASAESPGRLELLGRLQEEEGNTEGAISAYEKGLSLSRADIDLRLRLVRLYEVTGDIESAVKEYGLLAKSAPRDVQLSLRYAEMLLAQGKRSQAVAELDRIERLTTNDAEAGLLLLDFAERLEEKQRSQNILARLSRSSATDARFLVELGSRYYQKGDTETAHKTWKRLITLGGDRAKGYLTYGEVLIDHEAVTEGVKALREANNLAPKDLGAKKALALGLERAAAQGENSKSQGYERDALRAWQDVLEASADSTDPSTALTKSLARRHIVRLWKRTGMIIEALPPLEKRLAQKPPDLEAGRLLAEAYVAARAEQRAVETLKTVLQSAPGDRSSLLLLESIHSKMGQHREAISVLTRLVEADPQRAREYYERMARAAAAQNDRSLALSYAELAVQKSPTDPAAQASLGDLYLSQGRLDAAEAAFRRALAQDDRLHAVSLKLADILAKTSRASEALDVLFHVTRSARNLDAVGAAARRAISVSVPLGQTRRVEDVLRPLAISHPSVPLYRTLLLEVLSSQMYPLVLLGTHGDTEKAKAAHSSLQELADRSTGPLLLTLSGTNSGEQQIAISLLAHSTKKSAASGLLAFAEGGGPEEQRLLSVLALGQHKSTELSARLGELVSVDGTPKRGRIARAAAWALAKTSGKEGYAPLLSAQKKGDPELRAYAALGLSDLGAPPAALRRETLAALRSTLSEPQHGEVARSAAALALGRLSQLLDVSQSELSPSSERESVQALADAFGSPSVLLKQSALLALSQMESGPEVRARIALGLFSSDTDLRTTATYAATIFGEKIPAPSRSLLPEELRPAEMDASHLLKDALSQSPVVAPARRLKALAALETELILQGRVALRSSPKTAEGVLEQLRTESGHVLFGQLLLPEDLKQLTAETAAALRTVERLRAALQEEIIELSTSPDARLAVRALSTLRPGDSEKAASTLILKLYDDDQEIHHAALRSLVESPTPESLAALEPYLKAEDSWGRRRRVAVALGNLAQASRDENIASTARSLLRGLSGDTNPLVSAEAQRFLAKGK
jgi:tetratricopeptide (TPR) repeat protein